MSRRPSAFPLGSISSAEMRAVQAEVATVRLEAAMAELVIAAGLDPVIEDCCATWVAELAIAVGARSGEHPPEVLYKITRRYRARARGMRSSTTQQRRLEAQ